MIDTDRRDHQAIDLQGVTKTYSRTIHALRGVDIQVGRGEIFGLLGPNGAGKSTLVKIITTVVRADRARGFVLGFPLGSRRAFGQMGYLPEGHRFPGYLTGLQMLGYYAALARVPRSVRRTRAEGWLERLGLREWGSVKVRRYSKGMLQRLGLAQAFMNEPELILLDEPTDGLDPMGRRDVRQILLEQKKAGRTVFLNSHLLGEVEMICDRVAILSAGQVVREGSLDQLTRSTVEYQIIVQGDLAAVGDQVAGQGGQIKGDTIVVAGHDSTRVNATIDLLRSKSYVIEAVVPKRVSLEDIFMEAVGTPPARPASPTE